MRRLGGDLEELKGKLALARERLAEKHGGQPPEQPASLSCDICGGTGIVNRVPFDPSNSERAYDLQPCPCSKQAFEARRTEVLIGASGLEALKHMTFAAHKPKPEQEDWWYWGRRFAEEPKGWFWMTGEYGSGKTTLALCIANAQWENGRGVVFRVVPDLLDELRNTFDPSSEVRYEDRFEAVKNAPLLVLDDLGTEAAARPSGSLPPWATEKLFQILNHRWLMRLPTVVTTNLSVYELESRLQSRAKDKTVCHILEMSGPDYRQEPLL